MAKYQRLKENMVYKGRLVTAYDDYLMLPNGKTVVYDLIKHSGGAGVLPIDELGNLILVKQYRNSVDAEVYEIPAGLIDMDETGEQCARRELEEEIGCRAETMEFVAMVYGAIGICDEKTEIYLAEQVTVGIRNPDPEEFIEIVHIPLEQAVQMIYRKEIVDAKTVIAIQYYQLKRKRML